MKNNASFFNDCRPGKWMQFGQTSMELPVLFFRDDFFGLYYTAEKDRVQELMPSNNLHPLILPGGKAAVAIMAINYIDTTIGPYGEICVAIPVVYGKKCNPVLGTVLAVRQSNYPGFGVLVMHLPVTSPPARDAGRADWGYTKFLADIHFSPTPEYQESSLEEGGEHILDLRVMRRGFCLPENKPLITYSVAGNNLVKTTFAQKGVLRVSFNTRGSFLNFGSHEVAESIKHLGLSAKPFMQSYYVERMARLNLPQVIEKGVKPLNGYRGGNTPGKHRVSYV